MLADQADEPSKRMRYPGFRTRLNRPSAKSKRAISRPHPGSTIFSRSSPWENASRSCRSTTHQHSFKMPITTTKLSKNRSDSPGRGHLRIAIRLPRKVSREAKTFSSSEPGRISSLSSSVKRLKNPGLSGHFGQVVRADTGHRKGSQPSVGGAWQANTRPKSLAKAWCFSPWC